MKFLFKFVGKLIRTKKFTVFLDIEQRQNIFDDFFVEIILHAHGAEDSNVTGNARILKF